MTEELKQLLEKSMSVVMTQGDVEQQRLSFAYGNVNLHNPSITRDDISNAAEAENRNGD